MSVDLSQGGIYHILNTLNGKRYVGSAKCFKVRFSKHVSALSIGNHHARHLQSAYRKYGTDAFEFEPLLICAAEDLLFYEQRALDQMKPEYNSSPTAGNTLGVKCSPERKRKISEAHKGKKHSAEHRANISAGLVGRKISEKTRAKYRVAARRKAADPEIRKRMREGCATRTFPSDFGERISKAKKGRKPKLSEEMRLQKNKKIGEANRVRAISDEFRANASKGQRTRSNVERFDFRGEALSILDLAERFDICRHVIRKRINAGWDLERAATTPVRGHNGSN